MPNRMIKDSIHTSETVNAMSDIQFRLWVSLITYVDDYGRGDARPAVIRGMCFPLRNISNNTISSALNALARIGAIVIYEIDGRPYLCFPNWEQHQTIRNKRSKFPAPPDNLQAIENNCEQLQANVSVIQSNTTNRIQSETESNSSKEFDEFWKEYPKKVGKEAAKKAFKKVKVPVTDLIAAVRRQKQSKQWKSDGGQYIPDPAKWLNQGRWEDELPDGQQTVGADISTIAEKEEHMKKMLAAMTGGGA